MSQSGHIFQISISNGGVPKSALHQAWIDASGVAGDQHRDLVHHGGPDRAVCLFSLERILALQAEGNPIFPGSVGENITVAGVDWSTVAPGTRIRLGNDVVLEVTDYTTPCSNIKPSFSGGNSNRILQKKHAGWSRVYARVLQAGEVKIGDRVVAE
ncbi:MAG: MOSC domain-containing protein [Chloroflexi bacterium]|nr:MOSC domain-containing protein [Chloroflexota bacterium]